VLRVAIDTPVARLFDYLTAAGLRVPPEGARVWVTFGRRKVVGMVIEHAADSQLAPEKLKTIAAAIDTEPLLDADLLGLLRWAADYYHHPIGEVISTALPKMLREGAAAQVVREHWTATAEGIAALARCELRRTPRQLELLAFLAARGNGAAAEDLTALMAQWRTIARTLVKRGWIVSLEQTSAIPAATTVTDERLSPALHDDRELTDEQKFAIAAIGAASNRFGTFLLEGITGSGKTEVYLQAVASALARGKRTLVLVPEIGLTPQLVARFAARFRVPLAVLHSGLTATERTAAWRMARSGHAQVLLGTRSAVFAPVPDLGLIVIDEEHDASFKQQDGGFRYSARDLAIVRAQREQVPIVLGSATPSLESLYNVGVGRSVKLTLSRRTGQSLPPKLALVDLRLQAMHHGLSGFALEAIRRHLADEDQVLIYLNRRGYAPTLACTACGWIAGCHACDARLTVHRASQRLKCHHCGADIALPSRCPQCGYAVKPVGQGTERVEEALAALFPESPLARIDRDVVRKQADMQAVVARVVSREARVLVGTQMLTKGHHFPAITLAVVLNADHGLFSTDFRAAERLAQTIVQVAGRAGRGKKPGEVLIQTEYPEHPLLQALLRDGYAGFAATALAERKESAWPPFSHLAALRASAHTLRAALDFLAEARKLMPPPRGVKLLGPAPATMVKRAERFHAQLLIESANRGSLQRFLAAWRSAVEKLPGTHRVRWALDVDPLELF